ncbi:MAG: phosphatidylglycerophosphatase A [Bdellovibrionales bacterium]
MAVLCFGFCAVSDLDVFKPFPIRFFDKNVGGGFGVVADDLVAGLLANIILQTGLVLLPVCFWSVV